MRKLLFISFILLVSIGSHGQSTIHPGTQDSIKEFSFSGVCTAYLYTPWDYNLDASKLYPLIIYYHGAGERGSGGDDLPLMLNQGMPFVINEGPSHFPYSVDSDGDTTKFIVFSPQTVANVSYPTINGWMTQLLTYYNLRIDTGRIYAVGISDGGQDMYDEIKDQGHATYLAAAGICMSPAHQVTPADSPYYAKGHMWFFNGDDDGTVGPTGQSNYNTLNPLYPDQDWKLTVYSGGHCCWTQFLEPTYLSDSLGNMSAYNYLASFGTTDTIPTPPSDDTGSYKIAISPETKMYSGDTVFYMVNDINASGLTDSLFDEQTADPQNGVLTPAPKTLYVSGATTKLYYPSPAVVDLGATYKITDFWYYKVFPSGHLDIQYGTPGNWSTDTIKTTTGATGWFDIGDTVYTRYLKIINDPTGTQKVYELMLYGHLVGTDSLSRIAPPDSVYHKDTTTMGEMMGVNIYGDVPAPVREVGGTLREYVNQNYIDTATTVHVIDDIKFVFDKFSSTNFQPVTSHYWFPYKPGEGPLITNSSFPWLNDDLRYYKARGDVLLFATQNNPQYFENLSMGKPIDPVIHPDRDSTLASSYDRTARMAWTMAALFGKNSYPADSMQLNFPSPDSSGLNTMSYVETGNEMNKDWQGPGFYYSPQAFTAYSSAFYDGDANTMGSRMGIKNADSTIQVVMAGMAGVHLPIFKGIRYFSYYNRPDHKIPFDVINIHSYPTNGTNGEGTDPHAKSPEIDNPQGYIGDFVNEAHEICPRCEVWLTEWGYDRNGVSTLSVPSIAGQDSAITQAMWIARYWFELSFTGLDRITLFQIRNDPLQKDYDSVGTVTFNTSGLADGHYIADSNATNYYAFAAWYYQRTLWQTLYNYKPDSIIYQDNDSIWVYRYKNRGNDSAVYAIWSGTKTNRSTTNYVIKTGHASTSQRIITLADKAMYGDTTVVTSDASGEIGLTITENPILLFTTSGLDGGVLVDTSSSETPPTAHAGSDQTIRLPVNSVTLAGSGTDGSSSISSHIWTKLSGTGGTITTPSSYTSTVTGLSSGTYVLELKVTDANGLSDSDQMTITVNDAFVGPTAHAGSDQTIRLPTNSVTLDGSATAGDGTITAHTWTKVSGTGGAITTPSSYSSTFTGLTAGTYVLKLKVTDSNGLSDSDNVTITVNTAFVGPTAHAGSDQTLDPETTTTTLTGSATAGDGTITGYAWTKVSGEDCTITTPSASSTGITGLSDGNTYVFRLTVTDSNDLGDSDDVSVQVSSTPPPTGILKFRWLRKVDGYYYLIYQNTETQKFYYWKIL